MQHILTIKHWHYCSWCELFVGEDTRGNQHVWLGKQPCPKVSEGYNTNNI